MNYSVFIFDTEENQNFMDFIGSTDIGTAVANAAAGAAASFVGFDFFDKYANKLKKEKSVALTGSMVESVKVTTSIIKRTKYIVGENQMEDTPSKDLKSVITVTGRLESANTLFGLGSSIAKKKDASRIWEWANTPIGSPENDYYRDLVILVSSENEKRFRGFIYGNVNVDSYEEFYDKNGEGHFTLVMGKMLRSVFDGAAADIRVKGPDFEVKPDLAVVSDISKAAKTASKDLKAVTKSTEKILGKDNEFSKKLKTVDRFDKGIDSMIDGVDKTIVHGDLSTDNISDQIDKQSDAFRKDFQNESEKTNTSTKTDTQTQKDGTKIEKTTETANDGTKTITVKTTKPDGTVTVEKWTENEY